MVIVSCWVCGGAGSRIVAPATDSGPDQQAHFGGDDHNLCAVQA